MNKYTVKLLILASALFSSPIFAVEWQLDPSTSQLNFISIKKGNIAEIHQFKELEGELDANGQLKMYIDLASVDTAIEVRDERMKEYLFEVATYAKATICATVDTDILDAIAEGASEDIIVDATLELHGETKPLKIDVIITRLVGAKLSVASAKPVIVNASDYSLVAGINKLMALAKLPSISQAIPVTFYLTFSLKRN